MKKFDVKVVITRKQYLKLAFTLTFKKEKQFHNYTKESNYFDNSNNSFVGKMKDEACGVPLNIFVGLKVKMYTFITKKWSIFFSIIHIWDMKWLELKVKIIT